MSAGDRLLCYYKICYWLLTILGNDPVYSWHSYVHGELKAASGSGSNPSVSRCRTSAVLSTKGNCILLLSYLLLSCLLCRMSAVLPTKGNCILLLSYLLGFWLLTERIWSTWGTPPFMERWKPRVVRSIIVCPKVNSSVDQTRAAHICVTILLYLFLFVVEGTKPV